MEMKWNVNGRSGTAELAPGANHIIVPLSAGEVITRAEAELALPPAPKMFFNGYQAWTHCPEYRPVDRIRGTGRLPNFISHPIGLHHFGDYHFISYPNRKGFFHGFSWCYFRTGNHCMLLASLDERPGYTVFFYNAHSGILRIQRDCIGTTPTEDNFPAFDLFCAEGSPEAVFDRWFGTLGIRSQAPFLKGYSSWYNHYQKINEQIIRNDLSGAKRLFDPGDLFQIDDGWEAFVGDWETTHPGKFSNGLEPLVREIHDAGFQAGLWLAPFVCEKKSRLYREHADWLLRYKGKPWKCGPNWGGSYALDIDNPEVTDFLTRVFRRVFDEWGFDLVKLDFLYAAAPLPTGDHGDPGDIPFRESRAGRMIRALEFLRKLCGKKHILGCGVPLMPSFGLVDYCRVGCDVGLDWDDRPFMRILHRERISTRQSIENTVFRRELNGRAFGSDPDVFFLRDHNIRLSEEEKTYHAIVNALFGSVWLTSDDLNAYDEAKTAQYRKLAHLREATDICVDPDTLTISYTLDGKPYSVSHPH